MHRSEGSPRVADPEEQSDAPRARKLQAAKMVSGKKEKKIV